MLHSHLAPFQSERATQTELFLGNKRRGGFIGEAQEKQKNTENAFNERERFIWIRLDKSGNRRFRWIDKKDKSANESPANLSR